jgi:chaperonin cofactor prefoldin
MSNDDLTQNLSSNQADDKATQPTITAVFRLLQDVDTRLTGRFEAMENRFEAMENRFEAMENRFEAMENRFEAMENRFEAVENRLEALEKRLDQLETRIARDFAAVDARFAEISNEMKSGFTKLSDKVADQMDQTRVHHDADYQELLRRMRRLESEAS